MSALCLFLLLCRITNTLAVTKTCNVTDYGAKGDNKTDDTTSIQKAIKDCASSSAHSNNDVSLVILPSLHKNKETVYMSGALWLESNLEFYIEKNVRLLGVPLSKNVNESYPWIYTRSDGYMNMTHSSLLNGGICTNVTYNASLIGDQCKKWKKLKNIKIYGYGIIDGNGHSGWYNKSNPDIYGYRPTLLQLTFIDGLTIFNVTLTNTPFWTLHPLFSTNIFIENITINTVGPNTDGFDPDSCSNIFITKCYINTGDDCIALNAGKDADGLAVGIPSNNITIIDMSFGTGHGISIGSGMSGNVTNVLFENIVMNGTTNGVRVKSKVGRGGMVANVTYKNIVMTNVSTGIIISEYYQPKVNASGNAIPIFKNIYIENISGQVDKCGQLECLPEMPCENIVINNVNFTGYTKEYECQYIHGEEEGCTPKPCINTTNSLGISKLK